MVRTVDDHISLIVKSPVRPLAPGIGGRTPESLGTSTAADTYLTPADSAPRSYHVSFVRAFDLLRWLARSLSLLARWRRRRRPLSRPTFLRPEP